MDMQTFMFPEEAMEGGLNSKALYETMNDGHKNASPLNKFASIMQAKSSAPHAIYQAHNQVRRVHALLIVLLGDNHCLTRI
jgi:hypothetical protein